MGHLPDMLGSLIVQLHMGSHILKHVFHVICTANYYSVIIGWDFLIQHHVTIDLVHGHLSFYDNKLSLLQSQHHIPLQSNAVILSPVCTTLV